MSFFANKTSRYSGLTQVKMTKSSELSAVSQQGFQDFSTLQELYEEDPIHTHLGIITAFGEQGVGSVKPFYQDALESGATLEVNGWDGRFSFDLPIETDNRMKTVEDNSNQPYAGIDGSVLYITLNRELSPGQTITADMLEGKVLVVSDVEPVQVHGAGFKHPVVLGTKDDEATYDTSLLKPDVEYFETGHGIAEWGEKLAKVHMPGQSNYMTLEFTIGSPVGVETFFSGKANEVDLAWGTTSSRELLGEIDKYDENDMPVALIRQALPNGGTRRAIGTYLQTLAVKKFNTLMSRSLMFQRGFTIPTEKGTVRYNEGLWHQMRRGFIVAYARRMGFGKEHMQRVSDYIYKVNPSMDAIERRLMFETGTELGKNFEAIYSDEVNLQMNQISPLMGSDRSIPNPVSGTLDALVLSPVKFKEVYIAGVGTVTHKVNKGLDYLGAAQDRMLRGSNPNGMSYSTYSGVIWDTTDQTYSNNNRLPAGVTNIGGNDRENIYLVLPKGDKVFWGTENGRYSSKTASNIIASAKTMHESFFIYGLASVWMRDPSKFVMVELEKRARRGYN